MGKRGKKGGKRGEKGKKTNLVEFDDVWVVEHLHYLHLPVDLLQIHSIQLRFVNDFYCHLQSKSKKK